MKGIKVGNDSNDAKVLVQSLLKSLQYYLSLVFCIDDFVMFIDRFLMTWIGSHSYW